MLLMPIIQQQKYSNLMIFRSMLGRVLEGLSNFSPVKNLIKYILDRSLNELLSDQISLEDFKNGELLLTNIGLNLEKINRDYLLSSPYILHHGRVRSLKVTLPGWSELSTRSIEVVAEGLQVDLKPNKRFADNFKQAMREQTSQIFQQEEPGELNESNPMDFFRQLVKQIILNMKIRVENSVVRLFINEPTGQPTAKPQFYLMFRLPLLTVGKSEEVTVKEEETEQIKFDLIVPQLSLHLLKEGNDFPEYANQKATREEFPFTYPPVWHPSTILLVGQPRPSEKDKEHSTKLTITLTTYFKKQKKQLAIEGKISNFEATVDPIQLKILTRFIAQLHQFQRILKSVMAELGIGQVPLGMSRKDSKGKSGTHDFFSSIMMMSISQPMKPAPSGEIGLFNSMMQSPQMLKAAAEFNQTATQQLRKSGNLEQGQGWKNINFKQEIRVVFGLDQLHANFPKYVTAAAYERRWAAEGQGSDRVNQSLGCSHFRLSIRGLSYNFNSGSNLHQVRLRVAKLQDARLKNQLSFHHSVSEQFYELDSSTFYNTNVNQDYFTKQPQLIPFRASKQQHYCLEELFRLSEGQDPQLISDSVKSYAFMPLGAQCGQGAGLAVSFNGDSKSLRVQVKDVAVMVNFQIWKDVLNIIFPVFLYRKLYQKINLQSPQLAPVEGNGYPKNMDLFESQYRFSGMLVEQQTKEQKVEVRVRVGLVYCFYRQASTLKCKQNLFEQVERKILDSDNFSKQCFCQLNQRGLYAQIHELEWQQVGDEFNLAVAQLKAGLLSVAASKIEQDVKPILIVDRLRVEQSKVQVRKENRSDFLLKSRTFVPKARFGVQLPVLISFIDMAKKMVAVIDSLQSFKRSLSSKLLIIEQEMTNKPRNLKEKAQKQRVMEVFVGEVELRMLLISTFLRGVYFRKRGSEQEIKLDSLAIGLSKKLDIRLGQFKQQLLTQQYPLTEKYPGIRDTHLILEIGRQSKPRVWGAVASEQKSKRRLQRKLQFFDAVQREGVSLWVIIKEKSESGSVGRDSKAFRFDKARKNSIIEQEKRIRQINVLPLSLYLHAGNVAFLLQHKQQIEDIFKNVGMVMEEIRQDTKDIIQRKDSIESEGETTTEIVVSLKDLQVNIDIKPDFQYNAQTGLRVLSNSRMFVGVRLQKMNAVINPDSQQVNVDITLALTAHFLHYLDKDIELNPLLLNAADLEGFGFRKIVQVSEITGKATVNGKTKGIELQCGMDSLRVDLCLTTLPLLRLFLDHFLQHSLAGDYGSLEQENFIVLDNEAEQDILQDLTQKLEEYQHLLQEKRKALTDYTMREFGIRDSGRAKFTLRHFRLGVLKVRLFGGNEYKFLDVNSLYQSKATQRSRSQNPDLLNYIGLTVENVRVKAEQDERAMQVLLQLQRLELQLSYKRRQGLLWGAEKDYSAHLLKVSSPLKLLTQVSPDYFKLKINVLEMTAYLTDEVFSLAEQFSRAAELVERSNWKRQYRAERAGGQTARMLLLLLPEGRITASAEFKRTKLLNERVLRLQELVLHQEQANGRRIGQIFHDWAMRLFTSNLGTLVSGALFQVLSACICLLFNGIKQLLGLFFPQLRK